MSSVDSLFQVRSMSVTCLCACSFVISAIAFLIAVACCIIDSAGELRCVILKNASKIKSVSTMLL